MTIVNVTQEQQPLKYLVITQQKDPESLITTRVLISDNRTNKISLVSIEKGIGIEGKQGQVGLQGPAGKDGVVFTVLPISSGGTNNTTFTNDKIIYYDGNSLTSSNYSINELISSTNAITGIVPGTGLSKITNGNSVTINTNLGDGLTVTANKIIVDNSIARKSELNLGTILNAPVTITQGGTNNDSYVGNRLLYYDGTKISSFPLQTGLIVLSGTKINIVAGSGLIGGGDVSLPNGSVVLNIGSSSDIVVQEDTISLSNTGTPGTYTRITTDSKGRVINGGSILSSDILSALGYTPWHSGNDGSGSKLDADFLDGLDSSYFLNFYNLTGTINTNILPVQVTSGTYSKVKVNNKGLVIDGQSIGYSDVVNALNYVPLSTSGGMISGSLVVRDKTILSGLIVKDNLPMFGYNNREILPSYPRGFKFQYGGSTSNTKTGILAYYPADQELRLITNISTDNGVLDGGGSNDSYIDDVDGGNANSIYVVGDYYGSTGVVLLRHIGDQLYVSRTATQTIDGSKTFNNRLTVFDGISILPASYTNQPPFYISNNSGLVTNLNADLLDGKNDYYYRNASNLTGNLKYSSNGVNGVKISNLSGTPNYIAKFDNRTSNPSATVSDSLLLEENNTIIVDQQGNLCIGTGNIFESGSSLAVGVGNQIYSNNSLAVGFENIVLQDNSVSIGTNASGWIKNQFSFGAFRVIDDSNNQSKGQYSTVAMYLDADGGQQDQWVSMKPKIIIPTNKTMAYSAEILMNKVGGTGAAYILFNSGIITNRTISDDNYQPINITRIIQNPVKNEIFNDSQIKKHSYSFGIKTNNSDGSANRFINIKSPPLLYTSLSGQNIESSYNYKPEFVKCTGTFIKTNDGLLDIVIDKPIYSGWYNQNANSDIINIKSYNHGMIPKCLANLKFDFNPNYSQTPVVSVTDKDNFIVSGNFSATNISGNLFLNQKRSYPSCSFERTDSIKKYEASYIRYVSGDYSSIIVNNYDNSSWFFDPSYSTFYLNFKSSSNGFSGVLVSGSKIISECFPTVFSGETSVISGDIFSLQSGMLLNSNITGLSNNPISKITPSAIIINGYMSSGSNIISGVSMLESWKLRESMSSASPDKFYSGIKLYSDSPSFEANLISVSGLGINWNLILNKNFTSNGFSNTRLLFHTTGSIIQLSGTFSGNISSPSTGLIFYSGIGPNSDQYHPSGYTINGSNKIINFKTTEFFSQQPYVTGLLSIYPESGTGTILITTPENLNIEYNENSTYLKFLTTSTGLLPETRPYSAFLNTEPLDTQNETYKIYRVINTYLYPNTGLGIYATGFVDVNLDKNHGFKILDNKKIINELPINFIDTIDCPSDRLPVDNLFPIDSIHGHRISVKDFDNYILKSSGPDYFEQPIYAIYNISGLPSEIKITGIGIPKLYVNNNDIIKIVEWNGSQSTDRSMYNYIKINNIDNNLNSISCIPISDTGLLGKSLSERPNEIGTLKFVCASSGSCDIPISNNIYYNSYGGSTSSYPLDSDGKFVNTPQTGIYTISSSPSTCSSGTLCVNIVGFGGTVFSNIQDIIPRTNIGKTPNITSDSKGYVRPWGNDQKFYFDFSDGAPNINGIYYINDKLSPNSISISVPYNDALINTSGLVYIIDSNENIKSNLNPNKDNTFIVSNQNINGASTIKDYEIKSFNKNTRRWKHLVHLKNDPSIPYQSFNNVSIGTDNTDIYYFSPDNILIPSINGILYSLDNQTYVSVTGNNTITIPDETSTLFLKINTINGAGKWSDNNARSAPKINISGLTNYSIANGDTANISYSALKWTVPVTVSLSQKYYNNRPIAITVSDENGSYTKNLYLNTKYTPNIYNPVNRFIYNNTNITSYVNQDNYNSKWSLFFDTKYYDPNQYTVVISGYPGLNYPSISYDYDKKIIKCMGDYGNINTDLGIYNTIVAIRENNEILSVASGSVAVINNSSSIPSYTGIFDGLDSDIYLDTTNTSTPSFSFYIPTATSLNNGSNLINLGMIEVVSGYTVSNKVVDPWDSMGQRHKCTITLSNTYNGKYTTNGSSPIAVSTSIRQTTTSGTVATYSIVKNININIYKQIFIDQSGIQFPIVSDIQQPWSVSCKIQNGICGIDQSKPPNISLSHLPIIGNYTSQPLEYDITKTYNAINKNWNITIVGKKDIHEKYTNYTGIWPVSILAEDQFDSSSVNNNLLFMEYPYLDNVLNTYGTPNNSYFTTIDIKQSNNENNDPSVSVSQEPTAKLTNSANYKKYDKNLKLWEYAYSGGPMIDKWDSQILLDTQTSELKIQCKGMGYDKVYGVGKLNLIELDTVGLTKIPLEIQRLNPKYTIQDGSSWKFDFDTAYGLADNRYPPRILLSGLPTLAPCPGFNPSLSAQSQDVCCASPIYSNGKWKYEFSGIPLCFQGGNTYNFSIRAFDTVDGTQILGSAIAYSQIEYIVLDDHPDPIYNGEDNITLLPYPFSTPSSCKTQVAYIGRFGTVDRATCPIPTGLKSWSISGSLPAGLTSEIIYTGVTDGSGPHMGLPSFPYRDSYVSGELRINGIPTTFGPGGAGSIYNEKLTITFVDGRNKSGTKEIKFTDGTSPKAKPLTDLTIYFDSVKPVYTPGTGTKIIENFTQQAYQPPPNLASLLPASLFSSNNLNIFNFKYIKNGTNVYLSGDYINNASNKIAYCSFNNNTNNNGVYSLSGFGDPIQYQLIPDPIGSPSLNSIGSGKLSISDTKSISISELPFFENSTISLSTKNGILGCGKILDSTSDKNPNKGIIGRVKPSIIATLKQNGVFSSTENMPTGTGFLYSYINISPEISVIQSTDCYETGYFRISGIVLPRPGLFAPDAPPNQNQHAVNYTYSSSDESIGVRFYYGNSISLEDNLRNETVSYQIKDIVSNTGYILNNIVSNSDSTIKFLGYNYPAASVFSLFLYRESDIFPTYDIQNIPYVENEYFWIHKSGDYNSIPENSSFPPIIITGIKSPISCMSGQNISGLNYSLKAIGGYVPSTDQNDVGNFSITGYIPHMTGIVQRSFLDNPVYKSYDYIENAADNNTSLILFSCNDLINNTPYYINFYQDAFLDGTDELIYATGLIFSSGQLDGNDLKLELDYRPITPDDAQSLQGRKAIIYPSVIATTGSNLNYVYIQHNNIPFVTGSSIDLLFNHNNQSSSSINSYNNNIWNNLIIVSGSSYSITGYCSNPSFISQTGYCGLRQNYHNQIKISNIKPDKPGFWNFTLTGVPTGLYKDYTYKIITQENTTSPPYSRQDNPLIPKKYTTEYSLQITKPIRILNTGWPSRTTDGWILTFDIDGGSRPVSYNFPEISINGSGCIFDTKYITAYTETEPLKYKYPYDPINDRLNITLSNNSNIIDWSNNGLKGKTLSLTVTDDISSFTTGIVFMS